MAKELVEGRKDVELSGWRGEACTVMASMTCWWKDEGNCGNVRRVRGESRGEASAKILGEKEG